MGGIATFTKNGSHLQRFGLQIFVIAGKAMNLSNSAREHGAVSKHSTLYQPKKDKEWVHKSVKENNGF